ncbi:hypothetical protein GS531_10745 [Rhodococcus hoagii]|nr:hypothetical protein [Prescottella equi]
MRAKLFLDSASGQPYVFYSDESPPESTEWRTIRFESGLEYASAGERPDARACASTST